MFVHSRSNYNLKRKKSGVGGKSKTNKQKVNKTQTNKLRVRKNKRLDPHSEIRARDTMTLVA